MTFRTQEAGDWAQPFFESSRSQFADYFLRFVQGSVDFSELESEYPNLMETASFLNDIKDYDRLVRLHEKIQPFLDLQGHWQDSLALLDWAIESAAKLGDQITVARFTHDKADILNQGGSFREARDLYQKSEDTYLDLSNLEMALRSRHMRSMVVRAMGHLREAQKINESVVFEAEKQGLHAWLAHPYYVRALIDRDLGKYDQARDWIERSLPKLEQSADGAMIAQCFHFLGELALLEGDHEGAQVLLETSLKQSEQVGILRRVAATKRLLGDVARSRRDYTAAYDYYQSSLRMLLELGDHPQISRVFFSMAQLEYEQKNWDQASSLFIQAKQSYRYLNDPRGIVGASFFLMRIFTGRGKLTLAANEFFDCLIEGYKGGLFSWQIALGAVKRWGKW